MVVSLKLIEDKSTHVDIILLGEVFGYVVASVCTNHVPPEDARWSPLGPGVNAVDGVACIANVPAHAIEVYIS